MRLDGKVALITGGASNLGAEAVRLFAREGAVTVIGDVAEAEGRKLQSEVAEANGKVLFMRLDVTDESEWEHTIKNVVAETGKIDILINNAGLSAFCDSDDMSTISWHKIMSVNVTGAFLGMKYVIPLMKGAGGGSIINVSSVQGFVGAESGHFAYTASKGAVRLLTKRAAVQYGPYGIRVNSVHPGYMPRMRSAQAIDPDYQQRAIDHIPLRRIGIPADVASALLFIASDDSTYISGTELVVDGGFLAQ